MAKTYCLLLAFVPSVILGLGCESWSKSVSSGQKLLIKSHADFDGWMTEYLPNETCRWDIIAGRNKVPQIKFKYFRLDGNNNGRCDGDIVKVWSRHGPPDTSIAPDFRFCGVPEGLAAVTGSGRYMTVIFETNESNQKIGFSAEVIETYYRCPLLRNDVVDLNFYPGFGLTCQWSFSANKDLTFSGFSLKDNDAIRIYNKSDWSVIKHKSGAQLNQEGMEYIKSDSDMFVIFLSSTDLLIPTTSTYGFKIKASPKST